VVVVPVTVVVVLVPVVVEVLLVLVDVWVMVVAVVVVVGQALQRKGHNVVNKPITLQYFASNGADPHPVSSAGPNAQAVAGAAVVVVIVDVVVGVKTPVASISFTWVNSPPPRNTI
jgi:hypothetical protein